MSKAGGGELGRKLTESIDLKLDLARFRIAERGEVTTPQRQSRPKRSGGSPTRFEDNEEREINGRLGEAFVYEQFRSALDGFDQSAWVSTNRVRYGLDNTGRDDRSW